ncbi:MAG: 2Fe-2S iron-sulfur cluster-binding protein [Pseudomonas sp.]
MRVTLQPSGHNLEVRPAESILEAARRLGFDAPQSCRNGNCHICSAQLLEGQVRQSGQTLKSGEVLTCLASPLENCSIQWEGVLAPGELPVHSVACQVSACDDLGGDVWRLRLRAPAGKSLRYHAGQYLLLVRPDGDMSAFSIASAPHEGRDLELHILIREPGTRALIEHIRKEGIARVQAPMGDCHLGQLPDRPLVLIAAGTGLSQMQSMVQHCLEQRFQHAIHLYWGVRHGNDLYQAAHWETWQQQDNLILHKVISDHPQWPGRQGVLHEAIAADLGDLSQYEFYVSGSPPMVYATFDALVAKGMPPSHMHADAFAYAPRD